MSNNKITVTTELKGKRIDKLIAEHFPQYPRAALHRLFDSEHILLNGKVTKPGIKVREDDEISIDLTPLNFEIEHLDLPILYEDDNVLVIDKPSGIISHARGRFFDEASVASFLREHLYGKKRQAQEDIHQLRAGIVHRLDRATSGVMICAKNEATMTFLQKQFADRKVEKTYIAIVEGEMPTTEGLIDMPIERDTSKPQMFRVSPHGKPAQTAYKVLTYANGYTELELKPRTGRTHQLRVHLSELNHPIVGDELYGGKTHSRLLLHAAKLTIDLPNDKSKTFQATLPQEFKELMPDA